MEAAALWTGLRRFFRAAPAVGVVLLVVAAVLRIWVTPWLAQASAVPSDGESVTITSTGSVSSLVDLEGDEGEDAEPILVTRTRTTSGQPAASRDPEAAARNAAVTTTSDVTRAEDGRVITETTYRLAADRRSQALVDCCGASVDSVPINAAGAGSPLRFPWFTPPEPYPFYDVTARAAVVLAPIGTEDVMGIPALKFQQSETPVELGAVAVPGRLAGSDEESVTLPRTYSVSRTVWVDPTTGIVLREVERTRHALRDASGLDRVTLLVVTTTTTSDDVQRQVAMAVDQGRPVLWAHVYGPLLCILSGLLLLLGGGVALVGRTRAERVSREFPEEFASFDDLRPIFD